MTCRSGSLVITALSVTSGYETGLVCKSLVPRLPAASLGLQQPTRLAALDLSRMGISAIYVSKYLQYDGEVCATSPAKYAARVANTLLLHGPHARWDVSYHTKAYGMCLHFLRYVIRGGKKKKTGAKPFKVNPWLALHEHTSRDRRTT